MGIHIMYIPYGSVVYITGFYSVSDLSPFYFAYFVFLIYKIETQSVHTSAFIRNGFFYAVECSRSIRIITSF